MAENTSTYKAVIEIDTEPSIAELKKLKKQLKDTAAGSDDFKILQQKIVALWQMIPCNPI